MTNPKKKTPISAAAGKAAFEKLLSRLEQLPKDSLQPANTGVDAAAIAALAVARELNQPPMRARFERLPKEEFNIADLEDLEAAALAAWYAATELLSANVKGTEAKLPVELVSEATELKTVMLKVGDYNFDADTPVGRELADIRIGTGYRDLAQDLSRLGKVYRSEAEKLKKDGVRYRAEDADRAEKLSHRILEELGSARSVEQKLWTERVLRAWTLLYSLYNEVTGTAAWLRRREGGASLSPSLVAAGRTARRARAGGANGADENAEEPGANEPEGGADQPAGG
jgi:hypothetical protein